MTFLTISLLLEGYLSKQSAITAKQCTELISESVPKPTEFKQIATHLVLSFPVYSLFLHAQLQ